jgi:O-antigen/teichoic acid export membrane protein
MIWSLLQQVGGQAATMLVFFVLAALLRPSDFGLVGMAGAWLAVLNGFCETGLGAALIQREQLRADHLSTTFGINVVVGIGLTALGVALSWPASIYFRTPALQPVMAILSLGFLVRSFGLTQAALAQRELRFRALAVRDLVASVVGGCTGIGLALVGYGVWSLVVMTLVSALLGTVMLWRLASWRPRRLEISRAAAGELWPYSSRMLAFNLFKGFVQNTDRLIIGRLLGVHALGLYTLASRAVIYPVTTFIGALGAYLFPRMSRLQGDRAAVRGLYRAVLVGIFNFVLPVLVAAAVLAPVVVPLLGARWREAIPIIQLLTVAGLAQAVMSPIGQLMKALDRLGWLIWWSVGLTAVTALGLGIGSRWGLPGTSIGYGVAHCLAVPVILVIGWRLTGLGPKELLDVAWRPCLTTGALVAALLVLSRYSSAGTPWVLALGTTLCALVYVFALSRVNWEFRGLVARELGKLRPRRERPATIARPAARD